jgi:hypothetical protein
VLSRLLPPKEDDPAETLRWVRRLQFVMLPGGLLIALLLRAEDLGGWWLGLAVSAMALLSLATIGPSIRRAERHGPNDPATRPQRIRRAERVTLAWFGAFTVAAVAVGYAVDGPGLAIFLGALMIVGAAGGIWAFRRWIA